MPTLVVKPTLEATQAVGAILLHQFARERFRNAGIDEALINEAEEPYLDELAQTLLHDDEPNVTGTSLMNDSNNDSSNTILRTSCQNNSMTSTNQPDCSSRLNGSSILQSGEENYHSILSDSAAHDGTTVVQDRTVYHSMNADNQVPSAIDRLQESPSLASYGRELRRIAKEFEESRLRKTVKERASQVNLCDITKESFVELLEELFQGKITREKIVILFFFCTDVALKASEFAKDLVIRLMSWSFSYIINTVCHFVHKLGGWDKVLFYQLPSILITCCAALAICSLVVYLRKNLLRAP